MEKTASRQNGQHEAATSAEYATTGSEVLCGKPFHGSIFRDPKQRQTDPVFLTRIAPDEAITIDEARAQIRDFYGNIVIHTLVDSKTHEFRVNVGASDDGPSSREDDQDSVRAARQRRRAAKRVERLEDEVERLEGRIQRLKENHEEVIRLKDERLRRERQRREEAEDELARAKRAHNDEIDRLRREHRDEIDELRGQMNALRDEKNELYIESRLSGQSGSTLDRLIDSLADRAPDLLQMIVNAKSLPMPSTQSAPDSSTPSPTPSSAVGRPNPSSPPNAQRSDSPPQGQSQGHPAQGEDGPNSAQERAAAELEQVRQMDKPQLKASLVQSALATAATAEVSPEQLDQAVDVVLKVLAERGEEMTIEDWVEVVEHLAAGALEHELGAETLAEAIQPIARRFAPQGSMAETMLRRMPTKQATSYLIDAAGREPDEPVRELIAGVLGRFKETL